MMESWIISLILLLGSVIMGALFWIVGLSFFVLFLFIPLIPLIMAGRSQSERCLVYGWETPGNERFCPYDAAILNDIYSLGLKEE